MPRSIAEYLASIIPGAALLFVFFLAAEGSTLFFGENSLMAATFLPVVCIMPILSGVVSALALERLRAKPLTLQRGALIGFAAGFTGALLSALMLGLVKVALQTPPFGAFLQSGWLSLAAIIAIVLLDSVLAALGGAVASKVIKG